MSNHEEECKESHEARIRLIQRYGSFVEVEKLVKLVEEANKFPEQKYESSYSMNQFDLFKRL